MFDTMPDAPLTLEELLALRRDLPSPASRRAIRVAARVSREVVAKQFDPPLSRHTIRHYEHGTRNPSGKHLAQYVAILRMLKDA